MIAALAGQSVITLANAIVGNSQQNKLAQTNLLTSKEQAAQAQQLVEIRKTQLEQVKQQLAQPKPETGFPKWAYWAIGGGVAVLVGVLIYFITRKQ